MPGKTNLSEIVFSKKLFIVYLSTYFVPFFTSWIALFLPYKNFVLELYFPGRNSWSNLYCNL